MYDFIISISLIILVTGALIISDIVQFFEIKKARKQELRDNFKGGFVGEPTPARLPSEDELAILLKESKKWQGEDIVFVLSFIFLLPLSILVFLLVYIAKIGQFPSPFLLIGLFVLLVFVILSSKKWHNKYYLDCRFPVFGVSGEVYKKIMRDNNRGADPKKVMVVRGIEFDLIGDFSGIWDVINNGDVLKIEYSPKTKHIWKIEKVA